MHDTAKSKCSIFRQDRKLFQKIRLFKRGVTRTFIQLFLLPFIYFSLYLHNLKNEFFSIVIGQSKWSCSFRFLYFSSVKILCKVSNSEWICIGSVFSWAWITVCEELCQVNPLFSRNWTQWSYIYCIHRNSFFKWIKKYTIGFCKGNSLFSLDLILWRNLNRKLLSFIALILKSSQKTS